MPEAGVLTPLCELTAVLLLTNYAEFNVLCERVENKIMQNIKYAQKKLAIRIQWKWKKHFTFTDINDWNLKYKDLHIMSYTYLEKLPVTGYDETKELIILAVPENNT